MDFFNALLFPFLGKGKNLGIPRTLTTFSYWYLKSPIARNDASKLVMQHELQLLVRTKLSGCPITEKTFSFVIFTVTRASIFHRLRRESTEH